MQKNLIKYALPVVIIIAGVLWYLLSYEVLTGASTEEVTFGLQQDGLEIDNKEEISRAEASVDSVTEVKLITVHVCGEVVFPGVYQLEEGARVVRAIDAAGGVCAGAMQDYLNLASVLNDGDKVYVPSKQEIEAGILPDNTDGTGEAMLSININTATKSELMQLPGIGESKAESILAYRQEHGSFTTIEDIMQISGIKEAVYSQIKDYIKVQN